ncbi:MAG: DUF5615 family PIN-like protein [Gemmatimonadaceae bacterium]|nr:DUF5615 family PIN-like protein [Gemmatimonadaceae bacterium]
MALRLLFDENLAARLAIDLATPYPASLHVLECLGEHPTDEAIWEFARTHEFVIVTKDEDFQRFSVWRGFPPKVIWIRLGNCSTSQVETLLRSSEAQIEIFIAHPDAAFLPLG